MANRENSSLELRVAEESLAETAAGRESGLSFPEPLILLAKRKWFILKFVGIAACAAVAISLMLSNTFRANSKILPPQQNQSISTTAMLSSLGPLAALASQSLGLRNPSDIYVAMLKSETIANRLIDRFSLLKVYQAKARIDALHALEGNSEIIVGKDGVISISVEDRDPQRAADLANAYVDELETLTKTLAVTEAGKRRMFFERETKMASDDLAAAEMALKQTQEKTGLILLDPQSRAIIEQVSSLRARVAAQEVQIQSMSSYATAENPDLVRAKRELSAYQEELTRLERGQGKSSILDLPVENVPTAGLEYIRKLREVKYRETLFELLAKQYEAAKIDEARDALIVQQLDVATKPEKKSGPHRGIIVIVATFLAFLVAVVVALYREALEQAKSDPQFSARLQLFRFYLKAGNKSHG